jgi:hypothetical protein
VAGTLEQIGEIYDNIQKTKGGHVFDFEIAVRGDVAHTLEWMKSHGKLVQFIEVPAAADLRSLAAIARQHNAMLSFSGATDAELEQIGNATGGRFHCRMHGDEEAIRLAASSLLGKNI